MGHYSRQTTTLGGWKMVPLSLCDNFYTFFIFVCVFWNNALNEDGTLQIRSEVLHRIWLYASKTFQVPAGACWSLGMGRPNKKRFILTTHKA